MDSSLERFCKEQTAALQELCLVRCAHMADALHAAISLSPHVTGIITPPQAWSASAAFFVLHSLPAVSEGCAGAP